MKKILYALVSIVLLFFIGMKIYNTCFTTSKKEYVNYLNKNKKNLAPLLEEKYSDLEIENSDFYLLGENHGIRDIQYLDEKLFFYLNQKYGITYYVAEINEKLANQLNKYISNEKEEDSLLLMETVKELSNYIPQQASLEYYQKWKNIRKYNISNDNKIKVIGVDISDLSTTKGRDSIMYHNFCKVYDTIKNKEKAKFYGLFGYTHILQEKLSGKFKPFAHHLKDKKIKITSIACYNIDSDVYLPNNDQYPNVPNEKTDYFNLNGPLFYIYGINDLVESSGSDKISLFKLNNKNSPYGFDSRLINLRNFIGKNIEPYNIKKNTVDFIQYAVLIKKSEALSPLK